MEPKRTPGQITLILFTFVCVLLIIIFSIMGYYNTLSEINPRPDAQQITSQQCVFKDTWYIGYAICYIHFYPCTPPPGEYFKVRISNLDEMIIYTNYSGYNRGMGLHTSRTYDMKNGTHNISFYGSRGWAANITLNLISDGNVIHITKDQGVWVHPDGTEEIFYYVPIFNGTITDKWTVILSGQQNHRFEINNNTIVQTDEWWYYNMDIGESWEYKEYKIVYVEVGL